MPDKKFDVLIIGGGVSGTALLYELAKYTDLTSLGLVEKYDGIAKVNSHGHNNSQTIHCGDIETNYTVDKARTVKRTADMIVHYATRLPAEERDKIIFKMPKMVLGVGKTECDYIRKRYTEFKELFPKMELLEKEDIAKIEPNVAMINGELRKDEIVATGTVDAYSAADYQALSESFVSEVKKIEGKNIELMLGAEVIDIEKVGSNHVVKTSKGEFEARFVVVCAGGHSLLFAQKMGYGLEFSCLPMAGSFYFAPQALNGKVYTVQNPHLPFAAVHGDNDVKALGKTRFGPTALMLPMLERYCPSSFWDFLKVLRLDSNVAKVFYDLFKVRDIRNYIFRNFLFEVPYINRRLFLKDIKKIIPSLTVDDISYAKGFGGVRPQLIDKKNRKLMMGEAKINPGTGIVFNMTPSPGATSCLGNAERDMRIVADYLGCTIDEEAFSRDLLTPIEELGAVQEPDEADAISA
ncbi:FAD-dependent oxidoreductase [Pokkaliibacter sp. MBI-7]|uniref:FAD-dependent oxidoreductase n=1 Tax=Pokkaliibacter sp. MBI-7 TaxID=3040600 RepID=UPI00244C5AFD|nr:FAD-dependent oxidoreductase [Pokkaliibacter sp. MBI-7]MDH2431597.1 FAD-dependent oxidoreductase [Pokkaliibacter sp. MBI-7]